MDIVGDLLFRSGNGYKVWTVAGMKVVTGNSLSPGSARGQTIGHFVFVDSRASAFDRPLLAHEYIHILQQENGGYINLTTYGVNAVLQAIRGRTASGPTIATKRSAICGRDRRTRSTCTARSRLGASFSQSTTRRDHIVKSLVTIPCRQSKNSNIDADIGRHNGCRMCSRRRRHATLDCVEF